MPTRDPGFGDPDFTRSVPWMTTGPALGTPVVPTEYISPNEWRRTINAELTYSPFEYSSITRTEIFNNNNNIECIDMPLTEPLTESPAPDNSPAVLRQICRSCNLYLNPGETFCNGCATCSCTLCVQTQAPSSGSPVPSTTSRYNESPVRPTTPRAPPLRPFEKYDSRVDTSCKIEDINNPLVFYPAQDVPYKLKPKMAKYPCRYMSVELEVGGIQAKAQRHRVIEACMKWNANVVYDGSLPETGFEINTSPAKGEFFEAQIKEICKALRTAKAWVNYKCGMHVHIDSRDITDAQVLRLIEVYAKIEDGLFLVVPDSRRRNIEYTGGQRYCEKCAKKLTMAIKDYLTNPEKKIYWGSLPAEVKKRQKLRTRRLIRKAVYEGLGGNDIKGHEIYGSKKDTPDMKSGHQLVALASSRHTATRYFALNLHSHFYRNDIDRYSLTNRLTPSKGVRKSRGTIECRLAAGTTDPDKIIPWCRLWDNIIHVATGWPTAEINRLPEDPFEALVAVAPDEETQKWIRERKTKFDDLKASPAEDF